MYGREGEIMIFWISIADGSPSHGRFIGAYIEDLSNEEEALKLTKSRHPFSSVLIWELQEDKREILAPHFGRLLKQEEVYELFGKTPVIYNNGMTEVRDSVPTNKELLAYAERNPPPQSWYDTDDPLDGSIFDE
jgi:hypothetical protein